MDGMNHVVQGIARTMLNTERRDLIRKNHAKAPEYVSEIDYLLTLAEQGRLTMSDLRDLMCRISEEIGD